MTTIDIVIIFMLFITCLLLIIAIFMLIKFQESSKSITNKYSVWVKENWEKDNIFAPPLDPQEAVYFLKDYLLGEDWYSVNPLPAKQINAEIVHEILKQYSSEYRKEIKE